ncbi:hyalin-like [Amphiura filiformis]|uniref:hyalin-like n=1 Tax=Amphiura filiformis TaxID=82378 RepID=UPI003B20CAE7
MAGGLNVRIILVMFYLAINVQLGTQTCFQGWPIQYRSSGDGNGYTIVSSKEFSCYGTITQWSWEAGVSYRPFRAIVWRPVPGYSSQFKIVGINDMPSVYRGSYTHTVPESQRIAVEPGDVIGWSYQYESLRYSNGGSDLVHLEYGYLYSSLRVDQTRDINDAVYFRQYSISATVVEVIDVDPPAVYGCPSDIEATTELGTSETAVNWIEPNATDDTRITEEKTHSPGDQFELGIIHVAYIFEDLLKNRALCSFTVTVDTVDTTRPSLTANCTNDVTTTTELGTNGTNVSWNEPNATDLSGKPRLIRSHAPSTKFPIGQTLVTYTFIDTSNNTATCSFTVTVNTVDTTPPTVTLCPSDFDSVGERRVTWREPDVFDLSGNITTVKSHSPGLLATKETQVVYTFTDLSGNTAFCRFTIYITYDTIPPVVSDCVDYIEAYAELGVSGEPVYWTQPSATDDNGRVTLIHATHTPGEWFPIETTLVTYLFADDSYNVAYCNFSVVVHEVDTTPPTVRSCPSDISLDIESGTSRIPVSWMPPSAADLSRNVSLLSQSHHPGDAFTTGTTEVVYVFKDGSNNEARCAFQVNLREVDTRRPQMVYCPSDIVTNVELGSIGTFVNWTEPSATDESGNVTLLVKTHSSGELFGAGESTVTYLFTDPSNNIAACTFQIRGKTVDHTPPRILSCPRDMQVSTEVGTSEVPVYWTNPSVMDLSNFVEIRSTHSPGQHFSIGETVVEYTFEDQSRNYAKCNFTVTVETEDTNPPEIAGCPSDIYKTVEIGTSATHISWNEPIASDISGNAELLKATHKPGEEFDVGTTLVSYTYTDASNNSATCGFRIHISKSDTRAPAILFCPNNVTAETEEGSLGAIVNWKEPIAEDASGEVMLLIQTHSSGTFFAIGTTIVSYIFRDNANNMGKCSFSVTVSGVDKTFSKIFNCPSNIVARVEPGKDATTVTWGEPFAINLSSATKISSTHESNESFPIGSTQVTYTFEQPGGYKEFCNFTVTVIEHENTAVVYDGRDQLNTSDNTSVGSAVSYAAFALSLLILVFIIFVVVKYLHIRKKTKDYDVNIEDDLELMSTATSVKSLTNV